MSASWWRSRVDKSERFVEAKRSFSFSARSSERLAALQPAHLTVLELVCFTCYRKLRGSKTAVPCGTVAIFMHVDSRVPAIHEILRFPLQNTNKSCPHALPYRCLQQFLRTEIFPRVSASFARDICAVVLNNFGAFSPGVGLGVP